MKFNLKSFNSKLVGENYNIEFIIQILNFEEHLNHHIDKNKIITKDHFIKNFQFNYMQ